MDYEGCRGTGPYGDEASETDDEDDEEVLACAYRFARGRLMARHLSLQNSTCVSFSANGERSEMIATWRRIPRALVPEEHYAAQ